MNILRDSLMICRCLLLFTLQIFPRDDKFAYFAWYIFCDFGARYGEKGECLISTWETRFLPGMLQLAGSSRMTKVAELVNELRHLNLQKNYRNLGLLFLGI